MQHKEVPETRNEGQEYILIKEVTVQEQTGPALEPQFDPVVFRSPAKKWSVEKKTTVMLGLASIILIALNILFYWSFIRQKETSAQVNQSQKNLRAIEGVLSSIKDAETGQRGYLITGEASYLKPYDLALKTIDQQINELQTLSVGDSAQQQQLSILEPLVKNKLAELQQTVDLRKNQSAEAAISVVLTNQGQELMDRIRTTIQQMQDRKNQQLQNWLTTKEQEAKSLQLTFIAGIILNLFAFYLVYRAIQQEMTERKQAEASLKKLNEELELRVQERTAELKDANTNLLHSNRELEQFAYVASHDLQEPLRAINSYTQLLARKYQGNLDAKADKYIGYIVEGATRMQQLINDLLNFSRVGTQAKELEAIACEAVLSKVLSNLKVAIAESRTVVTHDPLPTVMGDEIQLIQLFQNLIGNAVKFRREERLQVHISAVPRENEWVFSISDNGIGMESEYFERIFTLFQRLHSKSEYPGTGIGLAVCKKIVERHQGRIWVESTLGVGSTFHFTIPRTRQ